MKIKTTSFKGLLIIEPDCFKDKRGFFLETFQSARYQQAGILGDFVQDNQSRSEQGVLRGLHFQVKRPQAQILTVIRGRIFDVAVDLRPASQTFGKWFGITLSDFGPRQIYMAAGFAHGFCVLSNWADLYYKVSRFYDPQDEGGVIWNDPDIGIKWPIITPQVSPKDAAYPVLRDLKVSQLPHDPPLKH